MHGWKLYTMVGGLLAVDAAILTAWQLRDPLERRVEIFPLENPRHHDDDVHIRPELEHCESEHNTVWLGEQIFNIGYNVEIYNRLPLSGLDVFTLHLFLNV